MPQHGRTAPGSVSIQLLQPNNFFFGDTVDGTVRTQSQEKKPTAVRIKLCARTKSKIIKKRRFTTDIYRGRVTLFEVSQVLKYEEAETTQKEDGSTLWHFQCQIPTSPGQRFGGDQYEPLVPFQHNKGVADVSTHSLPSAIWYQKKSSGFSGSREEAYVEYWIEASSTTGTATYPLQVRSPSIASPIKTFTTLVKAGQSRVISYRLLPELADAKLTFGQKLSQFFHLKKVPRYTFKVCFKLPTTWQLDLPKPLPLEVWIAPVLDEQSTTIHSGSQESLPPVEILSARVYLRSKCNMRAPGTFVNHSSEMSSEHVLGNVKFATPLAIPTIVGSWKFSDSNRPDTGEKTPRLDPEYEDWLKNSGTKLALGEILKICVSCKDSSMQGRAVPPGENSIYPSFSTYNIALSYTLVLSLQFKCANKKRRMKCEVPLRLLSAAEEQARSQVVSLSDAGTKKGYSDMDATCDTMRKIFLGF